jgi:stage II sporulation protein D
MKIITFFVSFLLCMHFFYPPSACSSELRFIPDPSQDAKPQTLKVLLAKEQEAVLVEVKGGYYVYDTRNGCLLTSDKIAKRDYVAFEPKGIAWGQRFLDVTGIRIVPREAKSMLLINGIAHWGCVEIHAIRDKLAVVNEVDVERYLKSILPSQFSDELHSEVMEAVAITARTHAYFLAQRDPKALWHVEASAVGYDGNALATQNPFVEQAIYITRHISMIFKGSSFPAMWTKDSTGKTANYDTIFRKAAKTPHAVTLPVAVQERPQHGWFFEMSKRELAQIAGAQKLTELSVFQDKESQRVYAVRLKDGNETRTIDFFTLQKAVGSSHLKSNDFSVEVKGDKVCFKGYGEGHGVGLCLYNATRFALKGEKAEQILLHFFPEASLKRNLPEEMAGQL